MGCNIVGVCTKQESTFNSDFCDLAPLCIENNIDYKYVNDINSQYIVDWISRLKPDIIFCFGWSNIIKKELLKVAPMGIVGFHPTKLPQNRGRHPLIWSLVLGLSSSASTFFFMDEGADSGDILSQKEFEISLVDDAQTLYEKVTDKALSQIQEFYPSLERKAYIRIPQDHRLANYWRKRNNEDGLIRFNMSSMAIYNLVRALTRPYIGAHIIYKGEEIKIWKIRILDCNQDNIEPGKVLRSVKDSIVVKTFDGAIEIVDYEFKILPRIGEYF